jgi:hypothetical protein
MAIYLTLVVIVLNHIAFGGSRVVVSLFALESGATQMQVGFLMSMEPKRRLNLPCPRIKEKKTAKRSF